MLSVLDASVVRAQGAGAVVPLPAQMAAAAQQYLPGVVGEPVPAFTIDPAIASLAAGARNYEIVSGPDVGKVEQHVIAALPRDTTGTRWRYTIANRTLFLQAVPGESVSITSEEDSDQGVLTRYNPPEPLLISGMNAGDTRKMTINVKVYDLNDPEDLEHKGTINLTFTYVGAYKVTVPAGTFDAALLRWEYKGKVGPPRSKTFRYASSHRTSAWSQWPTSAILHARLQRPLQGRQSPAAILSRLPTLVLDP